MAFAIDHAESANEVGRLGGLTSTSKLIGEQQIVGCTGDARGADFARNPYTEQAGQIVLAFRYLTQLHCPRAKRFCLSYMVCQSTKRVN